MLFNLLMTGNYTSRCPKLREIQAGIWDGLPENAVYHTVQAVKGYYRCAMLNKHCSFAILYLLCVIEKSCRNFCTENPASTVPRTWTIHRAVDNIWISGWVKVKVKWPCYRPGVAQKVGSGIALLFHYRGTRRGWVVSSTPRPHFTAGERTGIHFTGGWVGHRAGLDGRKISSLPGFDPGPSSP